MNRIWFAVLLVVLCAFAAEGKDNNGISNHENPGLKKRVSILEARISDLERELTACRNVIDKEESYIELIDLILLFSLPRDAAYNLHDWRIGSDHPAIIWETDGIIWNDAWFTRSAKAVVTIDGKPIYTLSTRAMPHKWTIRLFGPRSGISRVEIDSTLNAHELGNSLLDEFRENNLHFEAIQCGEYDSASDYSTVFEYYTKTEKGWVQFSVSCGSAGCSESYIIFNSKPDEGTFKHMSSRFCQ